MLQQRIDNHLRIAGKVTILNDFATLGNQKSFHYVSGVAGLAYHLFVNKEAIDNEMNLKHSEGYHKTVGSK